ncbi:Dehydroquinate synthase-like protein [Ceraceosorus guamensis]|uniref:Dehydroquinate synthase-like protein n=1 Tax=Ceraceosorus guamensis TaxID=1522189 RepID=A0A316VV33_9BASI|nr:Dehydroquinate synthase-like protein [Ceraceosorus guamensis]PWN40151.1 Dehydroquinate synthase-like protein [Ceraceosorus guamensis]
MSAPSNAQKVSAGTYTPTQLQKIVWGSGSLSSLPKLVQLVSVPPHASADQPNHPAKAMILTGSSLSKTSIIPEAEKILGKHFALTYTGIGEHSPVEGIRKALGGMKEHGANVIVAIGGGSPIDAAKAISYYAHQEAQQDEDKHGRKDGKDDDFIPIIAVPTTLSAAQTSRNAGYTDGGKKVGVSDARIVPRALVLDADLTLQTPERLWLSTGMRAVDHAIELLYRPDPSPLLRNMWLGALRDLFHLLPMSKSQPRNVDVRQRLLLASVASLWSEDRVGALGLSHALGHALGATYKIGHGITTCLTLAPTIRLMARLPLDKIGTEQLVALSESLDHIPKPYRVDALHDDIAPPTGALLQQQPYKELDEQSATPLRQRAEKVADAVQRLVDDLGLHSTLQPLGVPRQDLDKSEYDIPDA